MGQYREIMDTWFEEVWNKGNTDHIYQLCDIDMNAKGHRGQPLLGPKDFEAFHHVITGLIEDIRMEITHSVEERDWISALYRVTGKKCGGTNRVDVTGNTFLRFRDGKIIEVYEHFNFMEFFQQLDALPDQALEQCLSGSTMAAI